MTPLRILLLILALTSSTVYGQTNTSGGATTPPATDAAATPPAAAAPVTFAGLLHEGGPVMYVLGIAWFAMLYFSIEGFFRLRVSKLAPRALVAKLRDAINSGNYQEAWTICEANSCFLSAVVGSGLERIGRGKDAAEFAVEQTILRESVLIKANSAYLSVIGVVSPMIGLTGTVAGMIEAFRTLAQQGISNPTELAGNIGEVLVATASGLIVAIPAFVFYYILRSNAQGAILLSEAEVYKLIDEIPYDQLAGIRIGENFSPDQNLQRRSTRPTTSQKVSKDVTTNCPTCNAPITVGTTPCPSCGTVLDWGS